MKKEEEELDIEELDEDVRLNQIPKFAMFTTWTTLIQIVYLQELK